MDPNKKMAIALQYDGDSAPKITAKGQGHIADKIIESAKQNGVPLQENTDLARVLSSVPLNNEIPHELYVAVAEVIAFAYLLSGKTQ